MYITMQHTNIIFLQCTSRCNTPTLPSYNVPHDATHQHYLLTMYITMQHTIIIFLQCTSRCNTPTLSSYNVPHDATHHLYLLTMYLSMQHTNIIFLQCTKKFVLHISHRVDMLNYVPRERLSWIFNRSKK
jgi:hypothetical protein